MQKVVSSTSQITADWLTSVLKETGALASRVTNVTIEPVGAGIGLMGELARLTIEYEAYEALPDTMIVKCAAQNENKAVAQLLDFYNRETNFYNEIGQACPFRVPVSYYGAVDQDSYDFVLLMEDLGDVAPNDQIVGSSEEEAFVKVENIAALHARFWDKVDEHEWMYDFMSVEERHKLRDYVYMPSLEPALEKFAEHFDAGATQICRAVGEQYVELFNQLSPTYTFVHGDFRQDNFIYKKDNDESVVMDWQISGAGHGIFDVTYFVCQSLPTELRRRIEKDLIREYVVSLKSHGVEGYDFDMAWHDYRLLCLFCLIYPITVCGTLDLANERGRALAESMLTRNLAVIEDLGCAEFLD